MKKKIFALLASTLLLGLAACSKSLAAFQISGRPNDTNSSSVSLPIEKETAASEKFESSGQDSNNSIFQLQSCNIYLPNDNADGFEVEEILIKEITAETIITELKNRNVLPETVSVNHFHIQNGLITIDFNQPFADVVCSMGTSGELMIVGSVVNTFLSAFQAESLSFTVDGQILETGHTIYDFVMPFFSIDPQTAN